MDSNDDFLYHFINIFRNEYIEKEKPGIITRIIRSNKVDYEINLNPSPGNITINNYKFEKAIMEIYNKEYWLIKLWLKMYDDAKEFEISREIVRSFIKNCINTTTQDLLRQEEITLRERDVKSDILSTQVNYYIKILNPSQIISGMRKQQRELLIERSKKNKWQQKSWKDESFKKTVINPLNESLNKEYSELINVCYEYKVSNGINSILLFLRTTKGKSAIKSKIKQIINEE
jgi:hypothetical protein